MKNVAYLEYGGLVDVGSILEIDYREADGGSLYRVIDVKIFSDNRFVVQFKLIAGLEPIDDRLSSDEMNEMFRNKQLRVYNH